jgi:hypothetical protein
MRRADGLKEFYSRMENEKIELFVGRDGNPTMEYPHVHVIHRGGGQVDVVASANEEHHPWHTTLERPDGNQVNDAVASAWKVLSLYRVSLSDSDKNKVGYVELIHVTRDHSRVLIRSMVVYDKPRESITFTTTLSSEESAYQRTKFAVGEVVEKTTFHSYHYWLSNIL